MKVELIDEPRNPIETIYKAYRICYSKDVPTEIEIPQNTPNSISYESSSNYKMLEFIKKHKTHESPLEHCNFTFAIEGVSRALSHQLVRHRLASFSQQSQRYVDGENFGFVIPHTIKNDISAKIEYIEIIDTISKAYDDLIELGIPKEDARYILPNATTTNIIMTMNVRELIHFMQERLCIHAQWEIRELTEEIRKQVNLILPIFNKEDIMKCGKTCFECSK